MFPEGKSAAFYQHMFRAYDTDQSGFIEFPEFIQVDQWVLSALSFYFDFMQHRLQKI